MKLLYGVVIKIRKFGWLKLPREKVKGGGKWRCEGPYTGLLQLRDIFLYLNGEHMILLRDGTLFI